MKLTYHQREDIKRIVRDFSSELAMAAAELTEQGVQNDFMPGVVALDLIVDEIEKAIQP